MPEQSEVAEARLFDNRTPESVVEEAEERYGPFKSRVCLFSGGNDSLAVAHRCRDFYETLVWIETGTAVPGVASFVQQAAAWIGKPLEVYAAKPGEYERIVLGGEDERGVVKAPLGFPGPMQHTRCYVNLKERAIEAMLRLHKGENPKARVLALTGLRRHESKRRKNRKDITKRGALIYANPLSDWTNDDLHKYRSAKALIESDVAALLHRSGECNCGAYASPGEREMLRSLWPKWFEETIGSLERKAKAKNLAVSEWGAGREYLAQRDRERMAELSEDGADQMLCSDCQLRLVGDPDA